VRTRHRLIGPLVLGGLLLLAARPAHAERVWLVVAASSSSPAAIAEKSRALAAAVPNGLVVDMRDCGHHRAPFVVVAQVAASPEAARAALAHVRGIVRDAYVKRCDVKPQTLLAVRMSAVDPSIAHVPATAVNWTDRDRVSSAQPLPGGRTLVIARSFAAGADGLLEGRRTQVVLADSPTRRLLLEGDCVDPGGIVARRGQVAFHCAREQAGDHVLHAVVVFDAAGRKIGQVDRCRAPTWIANGALRCEAESVGPDGRLRLMPRTLHPGARGTDPARLPHTA
jgi:hypothetical protein